LLEPIITNFKGFSSDESHFSSEHSHDTHWCWCVYTVLTVFVIISFSNNEIYKYSISWFIGHLQEQRFAKQCTFPYIGTLYLMCIFVYLAATWPNITP
jgi:hypothetical protein